MKKSRVQNRLRLLSAYLAGRSQVDSYPITVIIENTGRCNLACPMCPRNLTQYPPKDFDLELFKRIIDEIRDASELVFPWGLGEPLLNPDVFRMIRYCRDAGLYTVLSTNATLLDEERSRLLIEAGLDHLIIAFDGATPEVYEQYRKNANFEKVRRNILRFLEVKNELEAEVFVVLQMVRLPGNEHQIEAFHRMWDLEGVNEIRIKEDEVVIPGVAREERLRHDRRRHPCYQLWQGPIHINYEGELRPCCHSYEAPAVGNVREKSVFELWNSPQMQRWREAQLQGRLEEYPCCRDCHAPNPGLPALLGSFFVDPNRLRRWIPRAEKLAIFYRLPIFRDR